jgi:hypothetical protein
MLLLPSTSPYVVTKTSTIRTPNMWDQVHQLTRMHFKTYLIGRNPFHFCTLIYGAKCRLLVCKYQSALLEMHIFCSYTQELECLSRGCMVFPADPEFRKYEAPVLDSGLFAFLTCTNLSNVAMHVLLMQALRL